jgi:hypothetical protein
VGEKYLPEQSRLEYDAPRALFKEKNTISFNNCSLWNSSERRIMLGVSLKLRRLLPQRSGPFLRIIELYPALMEGHAYYGRTIKEETQQNFPWISVLELGRAFLLSGISSRNYTKTVQSCSAARRMEVE